MAKNTPTAADLFRATGAELRVMLETGDADTATAAAAEIARRKANRAAKAAAKVAA